MTDRSARAPPLFYGKAPAQRHHLVLTATLLFFWAALRLPSALRYLSTSDFGEHVDEALSWLRYTIVHRTLAESLLAGIAMASVYPLIWVPLGYFLLHDKRSINSGAKQGRNFPDFFTQIIKSMLFFSIWMAFFQYALASTPNVLWSLKEATIANTVGFFVGGSVGQDVCNYVWHRATHTAPFCHFNDHAYHHTMTTPSGWWDSLYIGMFENLAVSTVATAPCWLLPCHVLVAPIFLYTNAFLAHVPNHSGREWNIWLPVPGGWLLIFTTHHHNDHHLYRRGNYANVFPFIDAVFGTRVQV